MPPSNSSNQDLPEESSSDPNLNSQNADFAVSAGSENGPEHSDLATEALAVEATKPPAKSSFSWSAIGVILAIALVIYMVVVPAVSMFLDGFTPKPATKVLTDMTFREYIRLHAVSGVVMLLFLATGASFGSFLNVVIYRLPRGLRLFWPPSACPNCGYKIKGMDNVPILGWVGLKGQCRQCRIPISSRYPLIEMVVAVVFVTLYYVELLSGGGSLPVRDPNTYKGIVWILLYTKWDLLSIYFLHTLMLTALLAWGMINYDRFRVPMFMGVCVVVLASLCMVLFPLLNPTSRAFSVNMIPGHVANCLAGLLVGAIGGYFLQLIFRTPALCLELPDPEPLDAATPVENQEPQLQEADSDVRIATLAIESDDPITGDSEIAVTEELSSNEDALDQNQPIAGPKHSPMDLYGTASKQPHVVSDALLAMLLVGSVLGPSAVLCITAITAIVGTVWSLARSAVKALPRAPITLLLFGVATIFVATWRQSASLPLAWWPKPTSDPGLILTWVSLLFVATIGVSILRKKY